ATFLPSTKPVSLKPCRKADSIGPSDTRSAAEISDHRQRLLRPCLQRPCRRAAEQREERAALDHSITSSARASSVGGISRPGALAVLRLITKSYLVGACTGRLAGFSSLRMRSM